MGDNYQSRGHSRNKNRGYRGGGHNSGNRSRGYSGNGRGDRYSNKSRFRGEKIPHSKYIAKAEEGYIAPTIYDTEVIYDHFAISSTLKRNAQKKGYVHPTKIQSQAIPEILAGKDVLGLASTGSGKTAAFLIPMINKVVADVNQKCLIIVPTRELASQIVDEFRDLSNNTGIHSTLVIGGAHIGAQIRKLKANPEFVIGTPGRLKDLFERRALDLSGFNNIILDEVDRMLDMGFVPDITFLISKMRQDKQTLFFSATMAPDAERIANTLLKNPVRIQVEKESPLKNVDQDIVRVTSLDDKFSKLVVLLNQHEFSKVLIFSRTKRGADKLSKQLHQSGFKADAIHGDKSQNRRQDVLNKFRRDDLEILVATDVAARGLDIPNVSHVINYDEPENYKDYIHRIGRTGRAGKTGSALTFVW